MMVRRALDKMRPEFPDLEIEEVDIIAHPRTAWKNSIRMIPTLVCGERRLSGIYLSSSQVRTFLDQCRTGRDST